MKFPKMKYIKSLFTSVSLVAAAGIASFPSYATLHGEPALLSPSPDGYLSRAISFAEQGMWNAVADQLQTLSTRHSVIEQQERATFLFLLGKAYSETEDPRCLSLLERFVRTFPASVNAPQAELARADFLFFAAKYSEAYQAYDTINRSRLQPSQVAAADYRQGLSMIKCGLISEARPLFKAIASNQEYANAATFYDAYIDYVEKNYREAYDKFSSLATDENTPTRKTRRRNLPVKNYQPSGLEAGYYLVQLDYLRGNYDGVVKRAESLMLNTPVEELISDTKRALGLSYFKLGQKEAAYVVLSDYVDHADDEAYSEARYALATLLYDRGNFDAAAALLEPLSESRDAIGQGASLYLGQIAASRGDVTSAAIAFERATRMAFDKEVSQSALYNYVAVRTRGGNIPFGTSVDLLERYVSEFPSSSHTPAVREYLATTYYTNKDYLSALKSIDAIADPTSSMQKTKQKILYELGMQQVIEGDNAGAAASLRRAVDLGDINPGLLPQANLWLGDALFGQGSWSAAYNAYNAAIKGSRSGALNGNNRALALYGAAYSLFKARNYKKALTLFKQASESANLPKALRYDAQVGIADCHLYLGDVQNALSDFTAIASDANPAADYAAWRRATILGLNNDLQGKISQLSSLTQGNSRWMPSILLDLADAYVEQGNDALAIAPLRRLVKEYPATPEASEADSSLRRIYAAQGSLREYASFLSSINSPFSLNGAEAEALSFEAAADIFNRTADPSRLRAYLTDYPDGPNAPEAWHLVGDALADAGDRKAALEAYLALEKCGDPSRLTIAAIGVMRTASDPVMTLKYARKVENAGDTDAATHQEAAFLQAQALRQLGKGGEAAIIWQRLAQNPTDSYGARSAVTLGEYYLAEKKYSDAERVLDRLIDSGTPQAYWLARGYIVLADVAAAQGNKYVARQYLTSLKSNYPGNEKDIQDMISSRLKKL